jgi:predicted Zn-dependent protease
MRTHGTSGLHAGRRAIALAAAALAILFATTATSAEARQFGQLGAVAKKAQEVHAAWNISDADEQQLGAAVSQKIRERYGVVQDEAVTRYVSLVGMVLAQATSRPNLAWKFIVLDTDGVNAFAAPGGYVHITRGALGLMSSESELADVLAHEITHVTEKHTIAAIRKGNMVQFGANQSSVTADSALFQKLIDKTTELVLLGFGRADELEADQKGIRLANSVGYAPGGLGEFLKRLSDRNKGSSAKQGLFASHPEMQERLDKLSKQIASEHLASTATLQDRYRKFISYTATPQSEIATVTGGAAGLTGGGETKKDDAKKDEPPPKKKGFGLGGLLAPGPSEKKSAEVTGSAAARGADTELGAKGGPVKTIVVVNVTPADIAAFKKEGNLK